jgi:hypothetical protein
MKFIALIIKITKYFTGASMKTAKTTKNSTAKIA